MLKIIKKIHSWLLSQAEDKKKSFNFVNLFCVFK